MGFSVLMVILPLLYVFKAVRLYRATARLQIERPDSVLKPAPALGAEASPGAQSYWATQHQLLTSRTLIESVIRQERLDQDPRYAKRMDVVQAVVDDITVAPITSTTLVDISIQHPSGTKDSDGSGG